MSTAPTTLSPTAQKRNYDEFIEGHVRKTQSYLRLVEVASAVMCIVAATLAYLIVLAVVDHWVLRGGLGIFGRAVAFSLLALGVLAYAARTLLPHLRHRVNPVYAADKIERAAPALKNSLLNFLLLRRHHPGVPEVVFRGLEEQTAAGIAQVPLDSTVDRARLMRIAYVLIAVLAVAALYKVFSPKDIFPSVGRVLAPWADIAAVTRVEIKNIKPGDGEAVLLTQVRVSAEVNGLAEDEQVKLIYSTIDKQAVDVEITMHLEAGERAHRCLLPEYEAGLGQDVMYRIEAGDCVSRTFRINAVIAPTMRVTSIEYEYPPYTELGTRRLEGVGDIKAIDGTKVTIRAEASQEIARAAIEVEGPRSESKPMRHVGLAASGELALSRQTDGNASIPEQTAYRLRFTTPGGDANDPIRHKIEIIPDKPPLVEILKPAQPDVELPADGELYIDVRARDPDFRLGGMRLSGRKDDQPLFDDDLLQSVEKENGRYGDAHRPTFRFVPARYQLKSGDVVHYQAVAVDNKTPNPNRSETPEFRITITDPQRADGQNADGQPQQQPDQPQNADDPMAQEGGRKQEGQQGQGAGGEQGTESGEDSTDASGSKSGGDSDSADSKEQSQPPQDGEGQTGAGQQDPPPADPNSSDQGGDGDAQSDPSREGAETAQGERGGARPDGAQPQNGSPPEPSAGAEPQEGIDSDSDAFEEIAKQLKQKEQGNEQKPGDAQSKPSDGASQGENAEPGERKDDASKGTAGEATDSGSDTGGQNGDNTQADDRTTTDGEKPTPKPDNQAGNEKKPDENGPQADQESGAGAKKSQKDGGGGKGNPGQTPPPPPEGRSQPKDKSGENVNAPNSKSEPMDSSTSDKESDSAEGNEGSRSGQGKEGGGQQSKQPGEGTEGTNTPSDSGGNASQESGKGENSTRGGDDTPTDAETGKPSDRPGDASQSSDGNKGKASGEKQPSQESPSPSEDGSQESGPSSEADDSEGGEKGQGQSGSESSGTGRRGTPKDSGPQSLDRNPAASGVRPNPSADPGADDANLEYARKQTELVLDYLEDQLDKGGVDPELKKKFGWTDEQFREFVHRHSDLRQRAQLEGEEGERARAQWDESLRSLGLRRPGTRTRTGTPTEERTPGLNDFNRTRIPQEFQDEIDAFRRDAFRNP